MKKTIIWICGILLTAACVTAVYRFCLRKSIPDAPVSDQVIAIMKHNDCFVCHSNEAKMPFYASLPVIGPKMQEHINHAVRFVELEQSMQNTAAVNEAILAKIEHAVASGSMPIAEYRLMHWGTGFNKGEKAILSDWIVSSRAVILGSEEHASSAIQPIPASISTNPAKVDLGMRMYNDTRISLDNTISCATCHVLDEGGADHHEERVSEGINGLLGGVNAPTVYNAYFNIRQFYNGRAADLQEQAAGPPVNPVEMGDQSWDDIVARLRKDKALAREFEVLYPGEGLSQNSVTDAIAEYEKTLLTPGSRFDLYLNGDASALAADELKGYKAFTDNSCASCHVGKNMGGQSFEYIGIYGNYFEDRDPSISRNSDDDGLMGFTGLESDLEKFKVPTLRNISRTAPYYHDGSIHSLEEAVRGMFKYQLGKTAREEDMKSIVSFLGTLDGKRPGIDE